MRVLKNDVELIAVDLQQYSSNNDILTFEFEKPLDFKTEGSLVQIIYETDKLDNIKNNNITIEEIENKIVINWRIKESITLTAGDKRTQIVIKNNDSVYLSKVFIIKILESLNVDNKIVETNLSYLEYWEERIKELAERIEQFEGTDLSQYITEILLNERLENYFNKLEIQEKLDKKANLVDVYIKNDTYNKTEVDQLIDNIDISEQLDNLATKEEVSKKLNIENYNTDKDTFATKIELESKANKEVVEDLSNSTLTKQEFNTQKDNFQLKNDNTLATNNKTIVGAINELKQSMGTGQGADLTNYYNKTETNNLLNEKVNKTDNGLQTTNKTIIGAINEVNGKIKDTTTPDIVAGKGIDIQGNAINIKIDNKTIGFNKNGQLEAKLSTGGEDEGNTNIKQYILKDVASGTLYAIEDEGLPINHKVIPSVFVLENSKQETTNITDFSLNTENIESNNGIKIQNKFTLNVVNGETPIINKSEFNTILGFKGGM